MSTNEGSLLQHQTNNLLTKITLLKSLPQTPEITKKIADYEKQVELRRKFLEIRGKILEGLINSDSKEAQEIFSELRESHKTGAIGAADAESEEKLMSSLVGDEHVAKASL